MHLPKTMLAHHMNQPTTLRTATGAAIISFFYKYIAGNDAALNLRSIDASLKHFAVGECRFIISPDNLTESSFHNQTHCACY